MSRGLGARQRLLLDALRSLESKHREGDAFYVLHVLDEAWHLGLHVEQVTRDNAHADRNMAWRARVETEAAAGDTKARQDLRRMQFLGIGRPYPPPRTPRAHMRPGHLATDINPARVLALLESRGLVERGNEHGNPAGRGAWVRLTDAGRRP